MAQDIKQGATDLKLQDKSSAEDRMSSPAGMESAPEGLPGAVKMMSLDVHMCRVD